LIQAVVFSAFVTSVGFSSGSNEYQTQSELDIIKYQHSSKFWSF